MKKSKTTGILSVMLALAAVTWSIILPLSAVYAQGSAQVSLNAPGSIQSGSDFNINIVISNVTNFDSATYKVVYNNQALRLDSVTAGQIGSTTIPVSWNITSAGTCNVIQNIPGLVGVTGSGYLATLLFHVSATNSQPTTVNLKELVLSNTNADPIPLDWSGATVNIIGSEPAAPSQPSGSIPTYPAPQTPQPSTPIEPIPKLPPRTASGGAEAIDNKGKFTEDYNTESADNLLQLSIPKETTATTEENKPLSGISLYRVGRPAAPGSTYAVIGSAYELGPDGASFAPPITLTFSYEDTDLPDDILERSLMAAYWDEENSRWIEVKNFTHDSEKNTITARVDHFSTFAVVGNTAIVPTPVFSIADLKISPEEADAGRRVDISAVVKNDGDAEGLYDVSLMVDGSLEKKQTLHIPAGESKTGKFSISREAGEYEISVNNLTGNLYVKAPAQTSPSQPEEPTLDEIIGAADEGITWNWIWGVLELVGVGAVMVVLVYLIFRGKLI